MGKTKREKQKLHIKAVKVKNEQVPPGAAVGVDIKTSSFHTAQLTNQTSTESSNMFAGITIPSSSLVQQLPEFDRRSTVTSKSLQGLNKKDKKAARHEFLIQKLEASQKVKKTAVEMKKRQHTPVVGDMSLMADALPTLDLLMKESDKNSSEDVTKIKGILKEKTRQKQRMKDIQTFEQIMKDPAFQASPFDAIREHLKNKLQQGNL